MTPPELRSHLLCPVFTDLVGSVEWRARLGDAEAGARIARYRAEVRRLLQESDGREIDTAGDGFFLTFETPSAAVTFGLRLQEIHRADRDLPAVRVGIHLGEVTERLAPAGSSAPVLVEGLAVDLASRIGGLAGPCQVLMSRPVFDSARQRLTAAGFERPVAWCAHGPYRLKGLDEPVEIGEAGFDGLSPLAAPPDSEKARRAIAAGDEVTLGWRPAVGLAIPGREHFRLDEPLGTGAIGEVWVAAHEKTHARRVFKFCFDGDRVRTLKREVVLLRLLRERLGTRHDIAQVIDWQFDHPPYYLETEHTDAGDLVAWSRNKGGIEKVPLETRLDLVAQAADALAAAHVAGVLHKDLKPSNILITEEQPRKPRVCLTDFGIGLVTSRHALEVPGVTVAGLTDVLLSSGESTGAGTRLYMAPEVIEGRQPSPRSDLYSLGVVLYQIVVGDFSRALAPGWERGVEDELLRADIADCVDGNVEKRLADAGVLAKRLRELPARRARERSRQARRLVGLGVAAALVIVAIAVPVWRVIESRANAERARNELLPEVERLIDAGDHPAAFELAREARQHIPDDPLLAELWPRVSNEISFLTEPSGAVLYYKRYEDVDGAWVRLGETPLVDVTLPVGVFRWRFERAGYEPREMAFRVFDGTNRDVDEQAAGAWQLRLPGKSPYVVALELDPMESAPPGMVAVDGQRFEIFPLFGLPLLEPVELERFWIDRTEVTNAQFQEFVDAGGYTRRELWREEFLRAGRKVPWEEAMQTFRDSTGRPGPATWVQGTYESKTADYPVGGVSWYEAAAFAEFRGKSLPTIYHWAAAALPPFEVIASIAPSIVSQSNLDGSGPARVRSHPAISASGAFDMAGNVSEWAWNSAGEESRYVLGGDWSAPVISLAAPAAASPWSRLPTQGFRLMRSSREPREDLRRARPRGDLDVHALPPMSDDAFGILRRMAAYDPTPLNPRVESSTHSVSGSREERVTLDAVYGRERIIVWLRLPDDVAKPYQTVVWFPGAGALIPGLESKETYGQDYIDLFVRSGRALVMPAYSGMYERSDGAALRQLGSPTSARALFVRWIQDMRRTIDYLETRPDIDAGKIAYAGLSVGTAVAPELLSSEARLRVALLWSGGLQDLFPEATAFRVAALRRITIPVLMLNGRHDYMFPVTRQEQMLTLLATPDEHKRHVIYDAGHWPLPRAELVKESVAWLDRYFGPVTRSPASP